MNELFFVIRFKSAIDRICRVNTSEVLIGRHARCGICLCDSRVSRKHALVLNANDGFHVRDLKSRNGTRLDGSLIRSDALLSDGSEMQIGSYALQVCDSLAKAVQQSESSDESTRTEDVADDKAGPAENRLSVLTPAQRRVYDLLVQGLIEKEVAARLHISPHTVHDHSKAIYKALSVSTRGELVARWAHNMVNDGDRFPDQIP